MATSALCAPSRESVPTRAPAAPVEALYFDMFATIAAYLTLRDLHTQRQVQRVWCQWTDRLPARRERVRLTRRQMSTWPSDIRSSLVRHIIAIDVNRQSLGDEGAKALAEAI